MLASISWSNFLFYLTSAAAVYYTVIICMYYRKEAVRFFQNLKNRNGPRSQGPISCWIIVLITFSGQRLLAQNADGNSGLNQANTMIRGYFDTAANLMYGIAGIVAIIGAIRVFISLNSNHERASGREIALWIGSCVFLVIVSAVIKAFFGL